MHSQFSPYKQFLRQYESFFTSLHAERIFAYRFGCEQTTDQIVLPLLKNEQVSSFGQLIQDYESALSSVTLGGPTSFEPIISRAIELQNTHAPGLEPSILLLLTDGDASNIQREQNILNELQQQNLVCCAVGFGDDPFYVFRAIFGKGKIKNFCFGDFGNETELFSNVFGQINNLKK
ncbi:Copine_I [Hexamita inflata]|uniref:Copine I n=1 Tax=Hexamita inflata TaxID=28002 RepID=A0AA86TPK0_9EUKA|nr:Copine I [Hexamita inflata]